MADFLSKKLLWGCFYSLKSLNQMGEFIRRKKLQRFVDLDLEKHYCHIVYAKMHKKQQ